MPEQCEACRLRAHELCDPVLEWCECDLGACFVRLTLPKPRPADDDED